MQELIYKEAIFKGDEFKEQLNYWLNVLEGELTANDLPVDFPEGHRLAPEYDSLAIKIPADVSGKLLHFSKHSDITIYVVLLTALTALLSRYSRNNEMLIMSPLLRINDTHQQHRKYNKRVIFRNPVDTRSTVLDLLTQTKNIVLETYKNQDYPLDLALKKMKLNMADFSFLDSIGCLLTNIHYEEDMTDLKFHLLFSFTRENEMETTTGNILTNILYNRRLFKKETIERLAGKYVEFLGTCISDVKCIIKDMNLLSAGEIRQLLYDFNNTNAKYLQGMTIHERFDRQVEQTPDHIAVIGPSLSAPVKVSEPLPAPGGHIIGNNNNAAIDNISISYRLLHEKSNRLAHFLITRGVQVDTPVALLVDRSLEMIMGILGILKAGGAYLPIDVDYPAKRILSILEESGVSCVLTHEFRERPTFLSFTDLHNIKPGQVEPVKTAPRESVKDLDTLPFPDRTLVNYRLYHQHLGIAMARHTVSLQATRGCPYQCAYCHKIWPKKHKARSAGHIFEEMQRIYEAGVKRFVFIDDIFNLDIRNSSRLLELVVKRLPGVQIFFPNGVRGDIMTKEYIDLMVEAGTINIDLALETGSPRLQKLIGKHLNLEKFNENAQYITQKYPWLILEMELMIGFPTETTEEALMTLDFLKNLHWVHFPNLNILKIYPNTDMARLAVKYGVRAETIKSSGSLAFHELPDTLPFSRSFTRLYQARFMNEYMMSRERLLHVLSQQLKILSQEELIEKYDSYFPQTIKSFSDILQLGGISPEELKPVDEPVRTTDNMAAADFMHTIARFYPGPYPEEKPGTLKILFLDLSQFFSRESQNILYDVAGEPLGLMYLLTYLNRQFEGRVQGKIAKSRIDFDSFDELERLIRDFHPHIIGLRALSYYKDFFHRTTAMIREWGIEAPIIAGGPYATSEYQQMLQDLHVDLIVMGEGELTLAHLLEKMMADENRLPPEQDLQTIPGIVFLKEKDKQALLKRKRQVIYLDRILGTLDRQPWHMGNIPVKNNENNLLYLISTSGSTGKPKGVMLEHRHLMNLLDFEFSQTNINFDRVLQFTSIGFDISANEIFSTLLSGGRLFLISKENRLNIPKLFEFIEKNRITVIFLTPALLKFIFEEDEYTQRFPGSIKHIIAAGEQLIIPGLFDRYLTENCVYLHNHYGPAETNVVTALTLAPPDRKPQRPSIGRPVSNTCILIMDENLGLIPIGAVGEIYISGANVGRGYLNMPELTAETYFSAVSFPQNSFFKSIPGSRHNSGMVSPSYSHSLLYPSPLYRTGDLGRWLTGGEIEFLGRKDQQVKIRGFRIQLEEIESHLKKIDFIKEAVVLNEKTPGGESYLTAYVVLEENRKQEELSEVSNILSASLPDYMIPSYFIMVEQIPLNANGKVDRKALQRQIPEPGENGSNYSHHYTHSYQPPTNPLEEKLAGIWAEILNMNKEDSSTSIRPFGIDDNFFQVGGNSLKATLLIAKIQKEFNREIPISEVFKTPTIKALARYIRETANHRESFPESEESGVKNQAVESVENEYGLCVPLEKKEYYLLSSPQRRLYILQQMENQGTFYNMPAVVSLEGELDRGKFQETFVRLIQRHASFRTSFVRLEEQLVQRVHDNEEVNFEIDYLGDDKCEAAGGNRELTGQQWEKSIIKRFIRPFDLSRAPLLRVGVINRSSVKFVLMVDMHHIISDGISMGIFIHEFLHLYKGGELPALRIDYKDFSGWQNGRKKEKSFKNQEQYWLNEFETGIPVLNLPLDFPGPQILSLEGNTHDFEIDSEKTGALKQLALEEGASLFMVLLGIFNIWLARLSGQEDIVVGIPLAGRRHVDFQGILGMFLNALALRCRPSFHKTFDTFLAEVRQKALSAFDNQDYQIENLVEKIGIKRQINRNPMFDVVLNFLNFDNQAGVAPLNALPGLKQHHYDYENKISLNHLTLYVKDTGTCLRLSLEYRTGLFKPETIQRFIGYFQEIVACVLENKHIQLQDINVSHRLISSQLDVSGEEMDDFGFI